MPDKVLVVDDEVDVAEATKIMLQGEGYVVVEAFDGEVGLQKANFENPDLILLDVVMPGKTGMEMCKVLKSQAKTKHIPVLMFTALGREVDRRLSASSGADGHLTKTMNSDVFLAEIKKQLEGRRKEKFSAQLGTAHKKLQGRKILLEFDPSTHYERLVRDFVLERNSHNVKSIVMTKSGSVVHGGLQNDGVEFELLDSSSAMMSMITAKHSGSLGLVYDSITDLALSSDSATAYKFVRNALSQLFDQRITCLFLLDPAAHDQKDVNSLRGLFSNQVVYGKEGIVSVRLA